MEYRTQRTQYYEERFRLFLPAFTASVASYDNDAAFRFEDDDDAMPESSLFADMSYTGQPFSVNWVRLNEAELTEVRNHRFWDEAPSRFEWLQGLRLRGLVEDRPSSLDFSDEFVVRPATQQTSILSSSRLPLIRLSSERCSPLGLSTGDLGLLLCSPF